MLNNLLREARVLEMKCFSGHGQRLIAASAARNCAATSASASGSTVVPRDDRHEIGVAVPARNDVDVDMVDDARAGGAAKIDADVESVRVASRWSRRSGSGASI